MILNKDDYGNIIHLKGNTTESRSKLPRDELYEEPHLKESYGAAFLLEQPSSITAKKYSTLHLKSLYFPSEMAMLIFLSMPLLSIHLSIYLSIYPSIHISIHLSIYLSIYPSIYVSMYLSIHPSIYLSIYLSCTILSNKDNMFIYLSIYLSNLLYYLTKTIC